MTDIERSLRLMSKDVTAIMANCPRNLDALASAASSSDTPDRWADRQNQGDEPVRDRPTSADDPSAAKAQSAEAAKLIASMERDARRLRAILDQYPGAVVAKPGGRRTTIDADSCKSCARDTRSDFPWHTPIDPRRPELQLCPWCGDINAIWGKWPTSKLVVEHHKRGEVNGRIPTSMFDQEMGPKPVKLADYTERAKGEAQAMSDSVNGGDAA